jgi:RNA polymerase sigma-70 factor (ECF subfamily)
MSTAAVAVQNIRVVDSIGLNREAQFEEIYEQYHRKVFSLCLRLLGHREEAEDVTQEVFLQVFRKLHTFRGEATFSTWLYRVTINAVLMHVRRNKKRARELPTDDGDVESIRMKPDKRRTETLMVNHLDLERAISRLSPGCRSVFVLHDVEGFEHKEIGQMLGISEGTSKSQLHDARLKLRKTLVRG